MSTGDDGRGRASSRTALTVLAWVTAAVWSTYLVAAELAEGPRTFPVIVQVMGSIGILYALFLVTRPARVEAPPEGPSEGPGVWENVVPEGPEEPSEPSSAAARWGIITIALALCIGGILYRLAQGSDIHQSAAFFVTVPTLLAITLALTPKAKSATGMIVKGLTLALLLSGIVLHEGFICILMASPLFYLIGVVIGIPIDRARRRKRSERRVYSVVGVGMLLLSLEGVTPATSFPQDEVVRVTRTIEAPASQVKKALGRTPEFDAPLPFYLKLGFPRPTAGHGNGLSVGDRRTIVFGTESPMEPMGSTSDHHHPVGSVQTDTGGALELKIVRSGRGLIVFEPVKDSTAFTHWIEWGRSEVRWEAIDADSTEVTWTLNFKRKLSPSWYFAPFQRYAGEKAVGYLIETIATP